MCTMGEFWQTYYEFKSDLKGVDLLIFERLDIIVQDSGIERHMAKFDSARIIKDAENSGTWGFCNKGYHPEVAEMGLWSEHGRYMDSLLHELNHVDHKALRRLYTLDKDEEHIVMIQDERMKEAKTILGKIPDALMSPDEVFMVDTDLRRWTISFY